MSDHTQHNKYIARCIELASESLKNNNGLFGSVIVCRDKIIAESQNKSGEDVTLHAEILAMRIAQKSRDSRDFSDCTIYSNFEPCPMCAFMIRELKFGTVVFAIPSQDMGGYSRWPILQDTIIEKYAPIFGSPPRVIHGIMKKEAQKQFADAGWTIQG